MQTDRRSFFQRVLTALGVAAVAPKVVKAKPSFTQYIKDNHDAIVKEFSTPGVTEAWWYRIKPPLQFTDDGFLLHSGHDVTYCSENALPYYLKKGWYIVGQPIMRKG